jgi:apolipoprotein N-acyltransferase
VGTSLLRKQSEIARCADLAIFTGISRGKIRYNAICAFNEKGSVLPQVYHKRNLVPIGEFTPTWLKKTFLSSILYYQGKRFHDTTSGARQVNFKVKNTVVAPLLCFENLFPVLCAEGIRQGGQLLVDCSDTSWFYQSILSDQMVAFCVLRAAENHRSFVFSTMLGPSTIIDSNGRILTQAPREQPARISAEVPLETDLTPFTRWCF